ncbi:type II secretion system protein GspE [Enterobacter sp.]|uniref:type II secretion system protein GspE n=1 Tax=Enterobacter sp. TaxID=42895 RepID=UPI00296F351D|nr:type II secretion system protein GspE [Enterobacter sp.]
MKHEQLIALCQRHNALLLESNDRRIAIAVINEPSDDLMAALRFATQKRIDIECWTSEEMEKHRQRLSAPQLSVVTQDSATTTAFLDHTLQQALTLRASDIHFEPGEADFRIRLRVDGVLHTLPPVAPAMAKTLVARLKVLGNLDIAERRLPQDGQFTVTLNGKAISFRIATLPCRYGEKVVLRLLHQVNQALELTQLGMLPEQLAQFQTALSKPQGLLLVTGPTGSGKTVTLYSALQSRNSDEVNICSVEDPVEIPLAGLNQTQINPRAGLSFQSVLRALLRQDPDIVMVGEIRDGETAEIAIKASQTGHLVLSTLHTNSTSETLTRIQQMGVAPWMLASALSLVVAQRLVRKLCPHCRSKIQSDTLIPPALWPRPLPRWQSTGCEQCYHGFYGRIALFEVLPVNKPLRHAIAAGDTASDIHRKARQAGMTTLFESGCLAVERGLTTQEELLRVLGIPHAD